MTLFCLSRNTEPCIWPDRPIALTSAGLSLAFLTTAADRLDRGLPPVVGVLLAPERLGMIGRIEAGGLGQDLAALVDGQRLGARGADVDAEKNAHGVGATAWFQGE